MKELGIRNERKMNMGTVGAGFSMSLSLGAKPAAWLLAFAYGWSTWLRLLLYPSFGPRH
jgi:hypothetical protein